MNGKLIYFVNNCILLKYLIGSFWAIIIVVLPFLYKYYRMESYFLVFGCFVFVSVIMIIMLAKKYVSLSFVTTDIIVGLFICYQLILAFTNPHICITTLYESTLWGIIYLVMRYSLRLYPNVAFWIVGGIIASGAMQSILALFQAGEISQSNHHMFATTGSFVNPGPLGGYTALACTLSISILVAYRKRISKTIMVTLSAIVLLTIVVCIISDSRAAWVALLLASLWILLKNFPQRTHRIAIFTTPILFIGLAGGAYFYRSASADGRFLIWKICTQMIQKKPWFGHGTGSFQTNYMNYQANYFEQGIYTPGEALLAADNTHAFNEAIRIACEYGFAGLVLMVSIGINFLSLGKYFQRINNIAICGLITYGCFACFSYPIDVFPLKICFPLLLGIAVPAITEKCTIIHTKAKLVLCSILISLNIIAIKEWYYMYQIEKALTVYYIHEDNNAAVTLKQEFPHFCLNEESVSKYAKGLFEKGLYDEAIPALEQATTLLPTGERYIDLGLSYQHTGNTSQAVRCFQTASCMLPAYITPIYYLFNLYREKRQNSHANSYAQKIINMPVKVETSHTRSIRMEATQYLKQNK